MKLSAKDLTQMALLVALLAVSAYITIPLGFTPVALTLQTLIINLIAMLLTPSKSFLTVLIYVLLGLIGLPVFSGGAGGPAKLFGPTGGYIFAFLLAVPLMSLTKDHAATLVKKLVKNTTTARLAGYTLNAIVIGMTIIYLIGTIYMKLLTGKAIGAVFALAVAPFIPLDLAKCLLAAFISVPLKKQLNKSK